MNYFWSILKFQTSIPANSLLQMNIQNEMEQSSLGTSNVRNLRRKLNGKM